jgi:hypothetical protein
VDTIYNKFLEYSAKENMKDLRRAFNNGENINKETSKKINYREAYEDVLYFQFIIERGYSGYGEENRDKFDRAFIALKEKFSKKKKDILVDEFLDEIKSHLSFIFDGHLALTTKSYGVGFYKPLRTYVSDFFLVTCQDGYSIAGTNQMLSFNNSSARLFPAIRNGDKGYFIGVRSYDEVKTLDVFLDGQKTIIPLHRIKSNELRKEDVHETKILGKIAFIKSPTFIGDNKENLAEMYRTGKNLSKYAHVIWDLSHNMGGNAEFAKQFVQGLSGCCSESSKIYQLQSSLVHAKETGQIQNMPYIFKQIKEYEESTS